MDELKFTEEGLKKEIKGRYVDSGSEASIYETPYDKDIAYRLYDEIRCNVTGKKMSRTRDEAMIENFQFYQKNIKLTDLPFGIIKENNIIIGQLIKYYPESETLFDFLKNNPEEDPIIWYLKALDILQELVENNICYEDVHAKNFMVTKKRELKLIDFSPDRVKINQNYRTLYYNMFQNFNSMVIRTNKALNLEEIYGIFKLPSEIKNNTDHPEHSFAYIRNELIKLENHKKTHLK